MAIDVGRRSAPALADLNGDGRADLVVGSESGETRVLWGTGALDRFDDAGTIALPGIAAPAFADLNGGRGPGSAHRRDRGRLCWYENAGNSTP